MRYFSAGFVILLLATRPTLSSVEVVDVRPSNQRPLITVLKDRVPQAGANLVVSDENGKQKLTLTSDSRGMVNLPHVHAGRYCIAAFTSPTLRADLCLQIAGGQQSSPSVFTMELVVKPPLPPTFEEKLAAAEASPISASNRAFTGQVVDPSGAAIPHVSIAIYRHRPSGTPRPEKILSDQHGRFSTAPSAGRYTAVFAAQGFATQFLTFEIAPGAPSTVLLVKLDLGVVSETTIVAGERR